MSQPISFTMPPDDGSTEMCRNCGEERGDHQHITWLEGGKMHTIELCADPPVFEPVVDDRSPSEARAETMGYDR